MPGKYRKWLLCSAAALAAAGGPAMAAPAFLEAPVVVQNPNPRVPLAAILSFKADEAISTRIELATDERKWSIEFPSSASPSEGLPLLGLRPDTEHSITVSITDADGETTTAASSLTYRTPALPADSREWPAINVNAAKTEKLEPGVTIISVRRRTPGRAFLQTRQERAFTENWGLLLGLDESGDVVWYYQSDVRIGGVEPLHNGNILFHLSDFSTVEIDPLGNEVSRFYAEKRPFAKGHGGIPIKGIETLHHQPHETSRGTFLSFSANQRTIENYYTNQFDPEPRATRQVMGDTIIEFDRKGEILWEWNAFDYLDVFRVGYDFPDPYWWVRGFPGAMDWTHGNGVTEDPRDGDIVFYLKHQDAVFKVDKETKEIKWIFGEPTDWPDHLKSKVLRKVGDFEWPYHAHNPRLTSEGTLILYENGQWGARPFTGEKPLEPNEAFSRGAEYKIDEKAMTVREIWTSAKSKTPDTCHAGGMGDAHLLPKTRNILIVDPVCMDESEPLTYQQKDFSKRHISEVNHKARIREYTRQKNPKVLWEVVLSDPEEVLNWQVYGGFRTPSLYEIGE